MGTNWNKADDDFDLETLLDDLDPPSAPVASRKEPLSNYLFTPARTARHGSTPRDAPAANFPQQLQAEQKQATDDGERFADERNEGTSPQTSICNLHGSHSGRDIERDSHEETSNHQDYNVSCSDGEERMSLKYRVSRDLPDVRHNLEEETNGQDREQDVRLSPGVGRDKTAAKGGCSGSSHETRARAGDRIRRDVNEGTGWDDPRCRNDFSHGGVGCSKEGVPEAGRRRNLQASALLSSRELPLAQGAAEVSHGRVTEPSNRETDYPLERETSPPITMLGYKIPGPAGALQNCLTSTGHRAYGLRHNETHFGSGRPSHRPMAGADTLDFREGPWLAAMSFLNDGDSSFGNHLSRSTIVTIKATTRRIPQLVAIINTVVPNGFGDLSVTLKDPTGIISGCIHRKVLTELEDGHSIAPGAVIIIRKVAVFSPTPFTHYLNITVNNVDQIFGKDTIAPRRREKAVNDIIDNSGVSEPGSKDVSQMHTVAKEGLQNENIAPISGTLERQRLTHLTHTLGNNDCIQVDLPDDTSPPSGKRVRKDSPLPTIVEDVGDLRKHAVTSNVADPDNPSVQFHGEARASQNDIAKAAGWDFSEDVELLLADDFF